MLIRSPVTTPASSSPRLQAAWRLDEQNHLQQVWETTSSSIDEEPLLLRPEWKVPLQDKPGWSAADTPIHTRVGHSLKSLVGVGNPAMKFLGEVEQINALEPDIRLLSNDQLQAKTTEFKQRLEAGESLVDIRPEAFAVAREACARIVKMRPRDVQILAGLCLDEGLIAQMATGEGKTLAAVAPAYLNALQGKGVHVVTVNDTLAERDAAKMGPIHEFLGLSVDVTTSKKSVEEKRLAYEADVTYGSNDVFGFDYLADRKAMHPDQRIDARDPYFALVDEVDQVLIDEANTPLIIASEADEPSLDYQVFANLVKTMKPLRDIRVDQDSQSVFLTESGMDYVSNELNLHQSLKALKAAGSDREASQYAMDWGKAAMQSRELIRKEAELELAIDKMDRKHPGFFGRLGQHVRSWFGLEVEYDPKQMRAMKQERQSLQEKREELMAPYPKYNLWAPANMHRVAFLQNAIEAQALFYRDEDYAIVEGPLERLHNRSQLDGRTLFQLASQGVRFRVDEEIKAAGYNPETRQLLLPQSLTAEETPTPAALGDLRRVLEEARQANPSQPEPPEMKNLAIEVWRRIATGADGKPLEEKEIKLIDEFKGRIGEGRRLTLGLHQALEAKEGLKVRPLSRTMASVQYPRLFARYEKFAGMTGTALAAKDEFREAFGLEVGVIPRHLPLLRDDLDDITFRFGDERDRAAVAQAVEKFEEGVPVLLVTPKVEHNQEVSQLLTQAGIPHQVLNTKSVKNSTAEELRIVSQGGRSGSVIVATNMAGRGQDFKHDKINFKKLAIHLEQLSTQDSRIAVRVTKEEEAERLIEWLDMGKQQGQNIPYSYEPGPPGTVQLLVGQQQAAAGVEVIDARAQFPGEGVAVIALGRNAARRIDEQVMGRTGRQGGPGQSQFMNSLDDDTVRRHTDKKKIAELRANFADGDAALDGVVNHAQFVSEQVRLAGRIDLQKYEDVLELHREAYYGFRDRLLESRPWKNSESPVDIQDQLLKWAADSVSEVAMRELLSEPGRPPYTVSEQEVADFLKADGMLEPKRAEQALLRAAEGMGIRMDLRVEQEVRPSELIDYAAEGVDKVLDYARSQFSDEQLDQALQQGMLQGLDLGWTDHLESIELLKQGVQLQTLAEKDPVLEFKLRAYDTYVNSVREMRFQGTRLAFGRLIALASAASESSAE